MADSKDLVAETVALKQTVKEILAAVAAQDEKTAVDLINTLATAPLPPRSALKDSNAGSELNKLYRKSLPSIQVAAGVVVARWKEAYAGSKSADKSGSSSKRKREDGDEKEVKVKGEGGIQGEEKKVKLEEGNGVKKEQGVKSETNGASSSKSSSTPTTTKPPIHKPRTTITSTPHQPPRTTKTDKPDAGFMEPHFSGKENTEKEMELRRKGVVLFYDALAWDNIEDKHVIAGIAVAIEQAVFESAGKTTGDAYRAKNRELYMSIKEATNNELRDRIVKGEHSPHDVANLSQDELKSRAVLATEAEAEKTNMEAARGPGATEAETDAFKCGKCGQRKTTYYQMQTRSADEPMTTFVTYSCVNCNNRWKFC